MVSLGYDADGNRISRTVTDSSDAGQDSYSYDFENRLIGLTKGTTGGTGTYTYAYDYRTRRIVRDESHAGAGGVLTDLVFSGGTSVQEYTGSISGANLTVEYIRGSDYGGGVGGILYTLRGGEASYTHANRRGDIIAKTSSNGSLTYQAQYEGFGQQTASTGTTTDRQKSNSKDTDPTNLVCEGYRYRDLETGQFLTRDPAGFVDGPNLYTYVRQNPWTSFDPEGLDTATVDGLTDAQRAARASEWVGVEETAGEVDAGGGGPLDPYGDAAAAAVLIIGGGAIEFTGPQPGTKSPPPGDPSFQSGGQTYTLPSTPAELPPAPSTTSPNPGGDSQKDTNDNNIQEVGPPAPPTPQKPPDHQQATPDEQAPGEPTQAAPETPTPQSGPVNPTAGRKSSKTLRKEWEEKNKKPWPQDQNGKNHDADHDVPYSDGGDDNGGTNITPRTRPDHIQRHQKNGDFKRWGSKRNSSSSSSDSSGS